MSQYDFVVNADNCSLKKCISEHTFSSKLVHQKKHFQNIGAHWNSSLKKYISKLLSLKFL